MKPPFFGVFAAFTVILAGCATHTDKTSVEPASLSPDITVGDPDIEFIARGQIPAFGPTTTKWDLIARYGPIYIPDPSSPANKMGYAFSRYNSHEGKGTLSKAMFTFAPDLKVTACDVSSEPISQPPAEPVFQVTGMPDKYKSPLTAGYVKGYIQNGRFRVYYKTAKWTQTRAPDFSNGKEPAYMDLAYNEGDAIRATMKTQVPDFGSFRAESLIVGTITKNPYTRILINESRVINNLLVRQIHFVKRTPPSGILRIVYVIYESKQGNAELRVSLEEKYYERYKNDIEELINSLELIPAAVE